MSISRPSRRIRKKKSLTCQVKIEEHAVGLPRHARLQLGVGFEETLKKKANFFSSLCSYHCFFFSLFKAAGLASGVTPLTRKTNSTKSTVEGP
jgi:hypothetical protein